MKEKVSNVKSGNFLKPPLIISKKTGFHSHSSNTPKLRSSSASFSSANSVQLPTISPKNTHQISIQINDSFNSTHSSAHKRRNIQINLEEDSKNNTIKYELKMESQTPNYRYSSQENFPRKKMMQRGEFSKSDKQLKDAFQTLQEEQNEDKLRYKNLSHQKLPVSDKIRKPTSSVKFRSENMIQPLMKEKKVIKNQEIQISRELAEKKLNYFSETFYRQNEVFPIEIQKLIDPSKFKKKIIPKIWQKNFKNIIIKNSSQEKNLITKEQNEEAITTEQSKTIKQQKQEDYDKLKKVEDFMKNVIKRRIALDHIIEKLKQNFLTQTIFKNIHGNVGEDNNIGEIKQKINELQEEVEQLNKKEEKLQEEQKQLLHKQLSRLVLQEREIQKYNEKTFQPNKALRLEEDLESLQKLTLEELNQQHQDNLQRMQHFKKEQQRKQIKTNQKEEDVELDQNQKNKFILHENLNHIREKLIQNKRFKDAQHHSLYEQIIIDQENQKVQKISQLWGVYKSGLKKEKELKEDENRILKKRNSDEDLIWKNLQEDSFVEQNISEMSGSNSESEEGDHISAKGKREDEDQMLVPLSKKSIQIYKDYVDEESRYEDEVVIEGNDKQYLQSKSPQQQRGYVYSPVWKRELAAQKKFLQRKEFLELIKEKDNYMLEKEFTEEQKIQLNFIQKCLDQKEIPLPLIHKIHNNVLILLNYRLTTPLCFAIASLIRNMGNSSKLRGVVLVNNYINDQGIFNIISGMMQAKEMKNFRCEKNDIGKNTSDALIQFLQRRSPYNLESLKLIDCKITNQNMTSILKQLSQKCYLKELKLVKVNLSAEHLTLLTDIVMNQQKLYSLDISWNEFPQKIFLDFINSIKENQTLRFFTLSMLPTSGILSNSLFDSLSFQIKQSCYLQHFDISHSFLVEEECIMIAEAMIQSRTLLSVHMSGNSINKITRERIMQILKINPEGQKQGFVKKMTIDKAITEQLNQRRRNDFKKRRNHLTLNGTNEIPKSSHHIPGILEVNSEEENEEIPREKSAIRASQHRYKPSQGQFFAMPGDILIYQ